MENGYNTRTKVGAVDPPIGEIGEGDLVGSTLLDNVSLRARFGLDCPQSILVLSRTVHDLGTIHSNECCESYGCKEQEATERGACHDREGAARNVLRPVWL